MIQTQKIIAECRRIGPLLSQVLKALGAEVRAGKTPRELDAAAVRALVAAGLEPVLKGYNGFPANTSIGINDDVLNTAPSDQPLVAGDLVKISLDAKGGAAYAAQAWTFHVPSLSHERHALLDAGTRALANAVQAARAGARIGDVSAAIQTTIEEAGFSVVRDYVGCGIGASLLEAPPIPCYGKAGNGARLRAGMVLNLHVIANEGGSYIRMAEDGWNAKTVDGSASAVFTAMVHVGENATEPLTLLGLR
jgi:methionyl aminopeptidase